MRNTDFLQKTLTYAEYETARQLYGEILETVTDEAVAVAMVYRSGVLDGKEIVNRQNREAYERRQAYKAAKLETSQPTANNEGSNTND